MRTCSYCEKNYTQVWIFSVILIVFIKKFFYYTKETNVNDIQYLDVTIGNVFCTRSNPLDLTYFYQPSNRLKKLLTFFYPTTNLN